MTIKKAIKILDWWIAQRKQAMEEFKNNWDYKTEVVEIAKTMIKYDETVIYNLEKIKSELIPNCKHPKKMHDTCAGVKYCMSCNMDL